MTSSSTVAAEVLLSIGKVARRLGVSARTLKNYERDGKIPSARRNPLNGHRIYTLAEVQGIMNIITGGQDPRPAPRPPGKRSRRRRRGGAE